MLVSESQRDLYLLKLQAARREAAGRAAAQPAEPASASAGAAAAVVEQQISPEPAMTPIATAGPDGSSGSDNAAPYTEPHAGLASIARSEDTPTSPRRQAHADATPAATEQLPEADDRYTPTPGQPLPLPPSMGTDHATTDASAAMHGDDEELDIIMGLRRRIAELEGEVKQVRSLQRMTSSFVARRTTRGPAGGLGGGSGGGAGEDGGEERRHPVRRSLGPCTPGDGGEGYEDMEPCLEEVGGC